MPTTCIPSHIRLSLTPTSSLFFFTPPPTPEIYTLSLHDALPILILTMHENDEYVFQALRAGASGYMLKEAADTELISALDRKSTRLNSSHVSISYAVFCLKKKKVNIMTIRYDYR